MFSVNVTATPGIPFSPSSYCPFPCLTFPVINSPDVASKNTLPDISLASATSNFNAGAESVSSWYDVTSPGTAFPGLESLSIPAYTFPFVSNIEYELISATLSKFSLSLKIFITASLFNSNSTYISDVFCASIFAFAFIIVFL